MTELILIRHGETDWNRELRFQGQLDVPLNAVGLEQARRVAERLAGETVHAVISSDLQRAQQTALAVTHHTPARGLGKPALEASLREQHFGLAEGLSTAEVQARHGSAWLQWLRFDEEFAFEGGESTRRFHARVLAGVQALAQLHPQASLVVVTHGGVLDMIYRSALGLSLSGPRQSLIPNAGLNRVRLGPSGIEIVDWADTRHLADMPPQPVYDQQRLARQGADAANGDVSPAAADPA